VPEPKRFAARTKVSVQSSQAEMIKLLKKHGAEEYVTGESREGSAIIFTMRGYRIKIYVAHDSDEQELKRKWRLELMILKGKLERIMDEDTTVEREFLGDIMLPGGQTVSEKLLPQLPDVYAHGEMPKLLGG